MTAVATQVTLIQGEDREIQFQIKDTEEDVYVDLTGVTMITTKVAAATTGAIDFFYKDLTATFLAAGTKASEKVAWITSITRSGAGVYVVNYTLAGLTLPPTIIGSVAVGSTIAVTAITATQCLVTTQTSNVDTDLDFSLVATQQGLDLETVITDATKGKFKVRMSDIKTALLKLGARDVEIIIDWDAATAGTRRIVQLEVAILVKKKIF